MADSNTVPTDGPCCATGARATTDSRDPNWRDIENEVRNAVVMVRGRITGPIAERVAIALEVTQRWVHDAGVLDAVLRGPDSKAAVADTMIQQLVRDIVTETASGWAPTTYDPLDERGEYEDPEHAGAPEPAPQEGGTPQ